MIEGVGGKGVPGGLVGLLERGGVQVHWGSFVFLVWAVLMVSKTLRLVF